ncbi:MAG: NADH:flavin oxidoreductase [Betaproteobacteria bacterium]|nr:NADH:flavin oxidoreductase [Betaproteobacteria bacterium]
MLSTVDAPYLAPGRIGALTLRNRLVRAATGETMANAEGEASDAHVRLYGDLARGGAGLLITGHLFVEQRGQYAPFQLGIHDDRCVAGLRRMTEAVHAAGGVIFAELAHAGSQTVMRDIEPVAPSVVPNAIYARQPNEMSAIDIGAVIAAFGTAARRAMAAGFDGIHLHSGNGYLLSQFNSPFANRRDDDWGGDADRRGRFLREVYRLVRQTVGSNVPVTARIGVTDAVAGGLSMEEGLARIKMLRTEGLDAVEVTYGLMNSYTENIRPYTGITRARALADGVLHRVFSSPVPEAYYRPFAQAVKRQVDIPVILVGGMRTTDTMADVMHAGDADFIAMARPFVREPDLPNQIAAGRRGLVDCVSCNICLVHEGSDALKCWRTRWRDLVRHAYWRIARRNWTINQEE